MMLKRFNHDALTSEERKRLLSRPGGHLAEVFGTVRTILERVERRRDQALRNLTLELDGVALHGIEVSGEEWASALNEMSDPSQAPLVEAIKTAAASLRAFHEKQWPEPIRIETVPGVVCWRRHTPIESVGLYIPGGRAPLISTVLMLGIPAALADCERRVLCTPPSRNGRIHPAILFAARTAGIERVFKVGGAQAIAAMAIGTETVPKVDKIFGPGNRFVTAAKALVSLPPYAVGIDALAGPSELLVIADSSCNPNWVAADLVSQAEHGPDSQVVLVTDDIDVLAAVDAELEASLKYAAEGPEQENTLRTSLSHSFALLVPDLEQAIAFANDYAPEHLGLACREAEKRALQIRNAGSVFVGDYSSVVFGDYASGTNHTLPTGATARFNGGLTLESFLKPVSFQSVSAKGVHSLAEPLSELTRAEGLRGHNRAAALRIQI
jgi:histidinol dehydrogenase